MAAITVHVIGDNSAHFGFCPAHCTFTLANIQHAKSWIICLRSISTV